MKIVEIYWNDLSSEKQEEILELLGDNGNYDVFPIAKLEFESNSVKDSLSDKEFNVVNKIARNTGMDCWFSFKENSDEETVVYDMENEQEVGLAEGIEWLKQGIPDYEKCGLSKEEIDVFESILKKLQLEN